LPKLTEIGRSLPTQKCTPAPQKITAGREQPFTSSIHSALRFFQHGGREKTASESYFQEQMQQNGDTEDNFVVKNTLQII